MSSNRPAAIATEIEVSGGQSPIGWITADPRSPKSMDGIWRSGNRWGREALEVALDAERRAVIHTNERRLQAYREARMDAGLSVKELAAHIGVSPDTILNWELRGMDPRWHLEAVKETLGIDS